MYIFMYTSDIVSFFFVFLTDIARQVGEQCNRPAAQSRMIRKCMTTLALRHAMLPANSRGLLNHREFVVMVGGQDPGNACWDMGQCVDHWSMDELQVWCWSQCLKPQSLCKPEWKSMPQMLSSEIWTRELYMYRLGTQNDRTCSTLSQIGFPFLLCPLSAEQFVAPAFHKGLALLSISTWQSWLSRRSRCFRSNRGDATAWWNSLTHHGPSWRNMEDGFWMVSGHHPPNADCSPGLSNQRYHCCVDSPEPLQMRCADFIRLRNQSKSKGDMLRLWLRVHVKDWTPWILQMLV